MKRWMALLLSLVLAVLAAGCGGLEEFSDPLSPPEAQTEENVSGGEAYDADASPEIPPEVLPEAPPEDGTEDAAASLPEDGSYTERDDLALYIHLYGHLPDNFITKKEAQELGWPGGALEPYAPGMCIGGNRFGNYEGLLPEAEGRTYTECDVGTLGAKTRGAQRIVFSNDGLIYFTDDHYESFTLLYGDAS